MVAHGEAAKAPLMASQPPSEFPQIFFRGRVVPPDGIPIMEQRTVHDEAERTRALAEGWTQDQRIAGENVQLEKLAHQEQQHRNRQAASRRREELLEQTLTKLRSRLEETPQPVRGGQPVGHSDATTNRKSRHDQLPGSAWDPRAYPQKVSAALKKRRRAYLAEFRESHNNQTMEDFAHSLPRPGLSVSAIYGACDENKSKCSRVKRDELLKAIGISVEKWSGR